MVMGVVVGCRDRLKGWLQCLGFREGVGVIGAGVVSSRGCWQSKKGGVSAVKQEVGW